MKKLLLLLIILVTGIASLTAQKGIGFNGYINDLQGNPIINQQILIAIDSSVYPYVQTLHHNIYSHPDGSFSFYEPNIPYSSFPLKVLVYTFDCEYERTGYEITFYYDNIIADSVFIEICTQTTNTHIDISIDTSNQICPTFTTLQNSGTNEWVYIYETFEWYSGTNMIGQGSEIQYLFEDQYNDIELKAILKDSITGFIIEDNLSTATNIIFPSDRFHILAGNIISEGMPIDSGTAVLLRECNSIYEFVDTLHFDTLGYYYFNNIPQCNYLVKIIDAYKSSCQLPIIPTYLSDELQWNQSTHEYLLQDEYNKDINLHLKECIFGPGQIYGYIVPQPNIEHDIILYNTSMEALNITRAYVDGLFYFNDLPYGNYILYSERYGYSSMSNTVNINQDEPSAIVYLQNVSGEEEIENQKLNIFPNPSSGLVYFNKCQIDYIEVYDTKGQLVLLDNSKQSKIDISILKDGIYYIRIYTNDNTVFSKKVIKYSP